VDECHRVIWNIVGKLIPPDEPGVRSIHDRLSVHRVYAPRPFRDTEISQDKPDGAVLGWCYEFQCRNAVRRALNLPFPFPVAPPRGRTDHRFRVPRYTAA
jgi:hypothetical protein